MSAVSCGSRPSKLVICNLNTSLEWLIGICNGSSAMWTRFRSAVHIYDLLQLLCLVIWNISICSLIAVVAGLIL